MIFGHLHPLGLGSRLSPEPTSAHQDVMSPRPRVLQRFGEALPSTTTMYAKMGISRNLGDLIWTRKNRIPHVAKVRTPPTYRNSPRIIGVREAYDATAIFGIVLDWPV